MNLVDIDYGTEATDEPGPAPPVQGSTPSTLHPAIQQLIRIIFDVNAIKKTMSEMEIDLAKMPLGKISRRQMLDAYSVLTELQELLKDGTQNTRTLARVADATNRFYTLVPHDFGMQKPPLINNPEAMNVTARDWQLLKSKIDMVDALLNIEVTSKMLQEGTAADVDPVDAHYQQLKTKMEVLEPGSSEYDMVLKYMTNTHAATHSNYKLKLKHAFKIDRAGETQRFQAYAHLPNHQLLWHGSRTANFGGILSQGLRIAPPEAPVQGYMFGKGAYTADMVSKSANYCFAGPGNPTGLLLLCEVALGEMNELTQADYNADKLPKGRHSTKGLGRTYPDPSQALTLPDGVVVPLGKPITSAQAGSRALSLMYNEFIVYHVEQLRIRYLLQVDFVFN